MSDQNFEILETEVKELIKLSTQLKEANDHLSKKNIDLVGKNKELKEVTLLDLRQWYRRLGDNPSHELMDEFNEEVQSWNLYDLHYMLSSTSNHRWIRQ